MHALTARLSIIFLLALLGACQGQTADIEEEPSEEINDAGDIIENIDAPEFGFDVTPPHQTIFQYTETEVDSDQRSISLYDVAPPENDAVGSLNKFIKTSGDGVILSLNTDASNGDIVDVSMLVENDNIWMLDHATGKQRVLWHSPQTVCDIQRIETLDLRSVVSTSDGDSETTPSTLNSYTAIDASRVVVSTLSDPDVSFDCDTTGQDLKNYYELSLELDESDPSAPAEVKPISEGLAYAQLIVGWRNNDGEEQIDHGYLGYSSGGQRLEFYSADRSLEWYQERALARFESKKLSSGHYSPSSLLNLTQISDFIYVMQLGLDLFLVDSYADVFSISENVVDESQIAGDENFGSLVIDEIFTDRFAKVSLLEDIQKGQIVNYLGPVRFLNDGSSLIFINDYKVYQMALPVAGEEPSLADYTMDLGHVLKEEGTLDFRFENMRPFSQFDLVSCDDADSDCLAAHDLSSAGWQFVTACEEENGCEIEVEATDVCVANGQASDELPTCTSSAYLHLPGLNDRSNDANLIGFMQYGPDYVGKMQVSLFDESLLIAAQLREKDVLLRYDYNVALSEPKILREQVLFGKDKEYFDLKYKLLNNQLFIDVLTKGALRSNECYRNYIKVDCDVNNAAVSTGGVACTGGDLAAGECFQGYREFMSSGFSCDEESISLGACNENNIVVDATHDTKWVFFNLMDDLSSLRPGYLTATRSTAINLGEIGEGALFDPELYIYDSEGETANYVGLVQGRVENVSTGQLSPIFDDGQQGDQVARVEALFDIVTREESDLKQSQTKKVLMFNTTDSTDELLEVKVVHTSTNASSFVRLDSTRKGAEVEDEASEELEE